MGLHILKKYNSNHFVLQQHCTITECLQTLLSIGNYTTYKECQRYGNESLVKYWVEEILTSLGRDVVGKSPNIFIMWIHVSSRNFYTLVIISWTGLHSVARRLFNLGFDLPSVRGITKNFVLTVKNIACPREGRLRTDHDIRKTEGTSKGDLIIRVMVALWVIHQYKCLTVEVVQWDMADGGGWQCSSCKWLPLIITT